MIYVDDKWDLRNHQLHLIPYKWDYLQNMAVELKIIKKSSINFSFAFYCSKLKYNFGYIRKLNETKHSRVKYN